MYNIDKTVGLLAGYGKLPVLSAECLKRSGARVVTIAFSEEINSDVSSVSDKVYTCSVGQFGKILKTLKSEGVKQIFFAGKVNKSLLYKNLKLDLKSIMMLFKLKDRKDDTIMNAVVNEFKKEGIETMKQTEVLKDLLAKSGVLTKKKPNDKQMKDISFGYEIAKEMGRLDIGQTVVVKNMAVMAVEAIEGTDAAIERGGKLAGKDAVVVKCAKPFQDERFDVPTVGVDTLAKMVDNKCSVLGIEAGKTLIVDIDNFISFADKNAIIVVSITGGLNES